jgi:hypothetical protein
MGNAVNELHARLNSENACHSSSTPQLQYSNASFARN